MSGGINLSDESVQVLLFVCVPLSGLLIFLVVWLVRSRLPSVAVFPTFSVTINSVGWQQAYVVYRGGENLIEFPAYIDRKGRIHAEVPKALSDEEVRAILPNLAQGLAKLRRQYLVYRRREPQPIPAEERDAAVTQLSQMGVEFYENSGQGQVQRAVIHDWPAMSGPQAQAMVSQVQKLMSKARATQQTAEILIRSDTQNSVD
jgi:hypothetical protein